MPKCGNCGKPFDNPRGVQGHQASPATDCSTQDGIDEEDHDELETQKEVNRDPDELDHDDQGDQEDEIEINLEKKQSGDIFDRDKKEENIETDPDSTENDENPDTSDPDLDHDPQVNDQEDPGKNDKSGEEVPSDTKIGEKPILYFHQAINIILNKLLGAEKLEDDDLDAVVTDTRDIVNEKMDPRKRQSLENKTLYARILWPHIKSLVNREKKKETDDQDGDDTENDETQETPETTGPDDHTVRTDKPI